MSFLRRKRTPRLTLLTFFSLLFLSLVTANAHSFERITDYAVTAELTCDAELIVTEKIRVVIEHQAIRHGITRFFPIRLRDEKLGTRHFDFTLLSANLDQKPVPFHSTKDGPWMQIAIGSAETLAPRGEHLYELRYRTRGHLLYYSDFDELCINAIGTENSFYVEAASFALYLPPGIRCLSAKGASGFTGEEGQDFEQRGSLFFKTTRPLAPKEGLTVTVAISKGISQPFSLKNSIAAHRDLALLTVLAFISLSMLCLTLGRHKRSAPTVPLFSPPKGLSPGLAASLKKRAFTPLAFSCDLIWGAVNGFLHMDLTSDGSIIFTRKKQGQETADKGIRGEESELCRTIIDIIFRSGSRLILSSEGKGDCARAYRALASHYQKILTQLCKKTRIPALLGLITGLVLLTYVLDLSWYPDQEKLPSAWQAVLTMSFKLALIAWIAKKCYAHISPENDEKSLSTWLAAFFWLALGGFLLITWILEDIPLGLTFLVVTLWPLFFLVRGSVWLTPRGRDLDRDLTCLSLYLRIAEEDRVSVLNPPDETVQKLERLLPYALALGYAHAWEKRCKKVLRTGDYSPDWLKTEETSPMRETADPLSFLTKIRTGTRSLTDLSTAIARTTCSASSPKGLGSTFSSGSSNQSTNAHSHGASGSGSGGGGIGGW